MSFYWLYDLPSWELGLGIVSSYVGFSLCALLLLRKPIYRRFKLNSETNEMVNGVISGVGVLYGILVGLVAVAAWQNYDDLDSLVSSEAAAIGALYRDASVLREPTRIELQGQIATYLSEIIDVAWPAHGAGISDEPGDEFLSRMHEILAHYEPTSTGDLARYQQSLLAYNKVSELRRVRLGEVNTGIPGVFWFVIVGGAVLTLPLMFFLHTPNLSGHLLMTTIYGLFMSTMVFLILVVDNPLRGAVCISPDPYQAVLERLQRMDPETIEHPAK